jgi:hypothetical protein
MRAMEPTGALRYAERAFSTLEKHTTMIMMRPLLYLTCCVVGATDQIPTQDLANGFYLCDVYQGDNLLQTLKLSVIH